MSRLVWVKCKDVTIQVRTNPEGEVNILRLATALDLDPRTVTIDGVLEDWDVVTGYSTSLAAKTSKDEPLIVTGHAAAGPSTGDVERKLDAVLKSNLAVYELLMAQRPAHGTRKRKAHGTKLSCEGTLASIQEDVHAEDEDRDD